MKCDLCLQSVNVGSAGARNLEQHQASRQCKETAEARRNTQPLTAQFKPMSALDMARVTKKRPSDEGLERATVKAHHSHKKTKLGSDENAHQAPKVAKPKPDNALAPSQSANIHTSSLATTKSARFCKLCCAVHKLGAECTMTDEETALLQYRDRILNEQGLESPEQKVRETLCSPSLISKHPQDKVLQLIEKKLKKRQSLLSEAFGRAPNVGVASALSQGGPQAHEQSYKPRHFSVTFPVSPLQGRTVPSSSRLSEPSVKPPKRPASPMVNPDNMKKTKTDSTVPLCAVCRDKFHPVKTCPVVRAGPTR